MGDGGGRVEETGNEYTYMFFCAAQSVCLFRSPRLLLYTFFSTASPSFTVEVLLLLLLLFAYTDP